MVGRARAAASALALALLWSAGFATPAGAHATFQGVKSVPPDADAAVTLYVPHERDEGTYNVKVLVAVASGWRPVSCATKDTWTCVIEQSGDVQLITFTKAEGSARAEDETFGFTVHSPAGAASAASAGFPTQQVYNSGEGVNWSGAPGSAEPAPLLTTLAAGEAAPTPGPTPESAPGSTAEPGADDHTTSTSPDLTATPAATPLAEAPPPVQTPVPTVAAEVATPVPTAQPSPSAVAIDTTSTSAAADAGGGGFPAVAGAVSLILLAAAGAALFAYQRLRTGR